MKVSKRYTDFQSETGFFLQYISFHFQRVGVSIEQVLSVLNWHDRYSIAYRKYADPQQHTSATVAEMAKLHKEGVELISGLRQQIKNDKQITLTADDYKSLGIHVDKTTYTRATKPTTAPLLVETEAKPHRNKFQAVDNNTDNPAYLLGRRTRLIIKTAYSVDAKPKAKDYEVVMQSNKATFAIVTPPEIPKGSRGYIRAAYVNSRGEIGPYSKPLEFEVN